MDIITVTKWIFEEKNSQIIGEYCFITQNPYIREEEDRTDLEIELNNKIKTVKQWKQNKYALKHFWREFKHQNTSYREKRRYT